MSWIRENWNRLSEVGTTGIVDARVLRDVQITNKIALYLGLASILYLVIGEIFTPYFNNVAYSLPLTAVAATVLLLNANGKINLSREVLCLAFPYYLLFSTLYLKFGDITAMRYLTPRIAMLAGGLFPVLLFGTTSRRPWYLMLLGTLACLMMYDPLHILMGVGYYQKGFTDPSYYSSNVLFLVVYGMLVMSAYALKSNMERTEREREDAIRMLNSQNEELKEANNLIKAANHEILTQNEEIVSQNDHMASQEIIMRAVTEKLTRANEKIEQQRIALEAQNDRLARLLSDTDRNLVEANEELMKHNNELQQFSYTVSHHLRGPVARLLGLTSLFKMGNDPNELVGHIEKSANELDQSLHDLTRIIDIRNEVYNVRERVVFSEQFEKVVHVLKDQLPEVKRITTDFASAPELVSIAPVVFSVMVQLVSNAVMFKAPNREMKVHIRSYWQDGEIVLSIADNGIGIDLSLYANDVFKMYRTFHSHKAGRGMGLYLARTQASVIGARIAVKSEVDRGSTFSVHFRPIDSAASQMLFANEFATLKYHARSEVLELAFLRVPPSEEYRKICLRAVEMIRAYKLNVFIADSRNSGEVSPDDQEWALRTTLGKILETSVRKVIIVANPNQTIISGQITDVVRSTGIDIQFAYTIDDAMRAAEVFVPAK